MIAVGVREQAGFGPSRAMDGSCDEINRFRSSWPFLVDRG